MWMKCLGFAPLGYVLVRAWWLKHMDEEDTGFIALIRAMVELMIFGLLFVGGMKWWTMF